MKTSSCELRKRSQIFIYLLLFPDQKSLPRLMLWDVPLSFILVFTVSGLTCKFSIVWVDFCILISLFCIWISNFPSTVYWTDCLFPIVCFWHVYQKSEDIGLTAKTGEPCSIVNNCSEALSHGARYNLFPKFCSQSLPGQIPIWCLPILQNLQHFGCSLNTSPKTSSYQIIPKQTWCHLCFQQQVQQLVISRTPFLT